MMLALLVIILILATVALNIVIFSENEGRSIERKERLVVALIKRLIVQDVCCKI